MANIKLTPTTHLEKTRGKWFIAHKKINNFNPENIDLSNLTYYVAPNNFYGADPFIYKFRGTYYIFFEFYDYHAAKLAFYSLNSKLQPSSVQIVNIDIGGHRSFPYIFEEDNKIYMIPETSGSGHIGLYEAVNFPRIWRLKKKLIENVHAADSCIIKHNNLFYIFSNIYKNNKENFVIYYSDKLDGAYQEHSVVNRNNNKIDSSVTRGAGNIFIHNGNLYRPAQVLNRGVYGEAVVIYRIDKLTPDEYQETPINLISKEDFNEARCIHTFSLYDDLLVIDAKTEKNDDPEYVPFSKEDLKKPIFNQFNINFIDSSS